MNNSIMDHDLHAMERQGMLESIASLKSQLAAMESDFIKCAKDNISPCFFCANDDTCRDECNFKWKVHN